MDYSGIFSVTQNATIENLNLNGGTINAGDWSGSLVGDLEGGSNIINVHSNVEVIGGNHLYVGGIVGMFEANMSQSSYSGNITGGDYTGGLVGIFNAGNPSIDNSYFDGNINANGNYIGGIAGQMLQNGTIDKSYSSGSINLNDHQYVAGLVGSSDWSSNNITNSFSATDLVGSGQNIGGILGYYVPGINISNTYFDQYLTNDNTNNNLYCTGIDTSLNGCSRVNVNNSTPNYFKNNNSNSPLSNWDFNTIWFYSEGNYPKLKQGHLTKPVIHLYGDGNVSLKVGDKFSDPGAYVTDADNSVLMHQISVSGIVDTSKAGNYSIRYDVCDNFGNCAATVTRSIVVASQSTQSSTNGTSTSTQNNGSTARQVMQSSNMVSGNKSSNSIISNLVFAILIIIGLASSYFIYKNKFKK